MDEQTITSKRLGLWLFPVGGFLYILPEKQATDQLPDSLGLHKRFEQQIGYFWPTARQARQIVATRCPEELETFDELLAGKLKDAGFGARITGTIISFFATRSSMNKEPLEVTGSSISLVLQLCEMAKKLLIDKGITTFDMFRHMWKLPESRVSIVFPTTDKDRNRQLLLMGWSEHEPFFIIFNSRDQVDIFLQDTTFVGEEMRKIIRREVRKAKLRRRSRRGATVYSHWLLFWMCIGVFLVSRDRECMDQLQNRDCIL